MYVSCTLAGLQISAAIRRMDRRCRRAALSVVAVVAVLAMGPVSAQTCTVDFSPVVAIAAGGSPYAVATGDLDGDQDLDLVLANFNDTVAVLLNTGGAFSSPVQLAVGSRPYSIELGDLDGDGDLDIVVVNTQTDDISVLLNMGNAVFAPEIRYDVGNLPVDVALGDLDGDGDIDAVVSSWVPGSISFLRNNGDGSFAPKISLDVGPNTPAGIALTDLELDGDLDIVTANFSGFSGSGLIRLKNNGSGTFTGPFAMYLSPAEPIDVAAGDINSDGFPDVVMVNTDGGQATVLINNGFGGFLLSDVTSYPNGGSPRGVRLGDLDQDGDLDVVTANETDDEISVLLNAGDGTLLPRVTFYTGDAPFGLVLGDFDGDTDLDVATPNVLDNRVGLLLNTCDPTRRNRITKYQRAP